MKKLSLFTALVAILSFSSCEKEEDDSAFLDTHSEKMWNLVERDGDSVSSDEHIGFLKQSGRGCIGIIMMIVLVYCEKCASGLKKLYPHLSPPNSNHF